MRASSLPVRPCAVPGRLELPRCSRNGWSHRCPWPGKGRGPPCSSDRAHVPARRPASSWPSCSLVPFVVCDRERLAGATFCLSHPRMFPGRREQQGDVTCADISTQGTSESATTTSLGYAPRLGQLCTAHPAQPCTASRGRPVDGEAAAWSYDNAHQCTGPPFGATPDTGADRGCRLPHSFPGKRRPSRLARDGRVRDGRVRDGSV